MRGLANTLLFDVNDAIQQLPGATRAREILVSNALEYLDTLAKEAGGDTALQLELAAAYEKVASMQGQAYAASKGDAPAALASYGKAIALLEPIVAAEPGNAQAVRALAHLSLLQSRLLLLQGNAKAAVAGSQRAIGLLEPIAQAQPDLETQSELAGALQVHVVNIFYGGSSPEERQGYARRAIAILEALASANPDNLEIAQNLGAAYSTLASALAGSEPDRAAIEESLSLLRKALAIDERLVAESGGQNVDYLRSLYADRQNIAVHLYELGDVRGALDMLRGTKSLLEQRAADPDDVQVHLDTVLAAWQEGRYLRELGEEKEAEAVLTDNIRMIRKLGLENDNLQVVFVRAACETQLGLLETSARDPVRRQPRRPAATLEPRARPVRGGRPGFRAHHRGRDPRLHGHALRQRRPRRACAQRGGDRDTDHGTSRRVSRFSRALRASCREPHFAAFRCPPHGSTIPAAISSSRASRRGLLADAP